MGKRIDKYDLKIEENLFNFINNEVLDDLNFEKETFWKNFSNFILDYAPTNNSLLKKRLDFLFIFHFQVSSFSHPYQCHHHW